MRELEKLIATLKQADFLQEQLEAAEKLKAQLQQDELTIAVIGQFKRGKSSLINAMLGEKLLPVAIIPLTTVATELRWGESFRAQVRFTDGRVEQIERSDLVEYCGEEKNPGNQKKVKVVQIWTPNQPFGEGCVLVDTPGVGSVHQHNTDTTYSYVEHSDAVLFLLSVDSPVSETEREFLLWARQYAVRFFFAVNKADTISESDLDIFMNFCGEVLKQAMEKAVPLCAVSARTGAGIDTIVGELRRQLQTAHGGILEDSVRKKLDLIRSQAVAKLKLARRAASLPQQKLADKLERVRQEQNKLTGFGEEVQVLARHRTDLLAERVKGELEQRAEQLHYETRQKGESLMAALQDLSARDFEREMRQGMEKFLKDKLGELDRKGKVMLDAGYRELTELLTGKAEEAGQFLSNVLNEEFGLEYPVPELNFQISQRSDFTLHLGAGGTLLLNMEALSRFLPRKQANARYFRRSTDQADKDIERNLNNMLSDYRYKLRESLRPLCRQLTEEISKMSSELSKLVSHMEEYLEDVQQQRMREVDQLNILLKLIQ